MIKRVLLAAATAAVVLGGAPAPASAGVVGTCHGDGSTAAACPICITNRYVDICFF